MMGIKNWEAYKASLWDLNIFDHCFRPTRLAFGDIDAIVERRGCFLVLETKFPNVNIPQGQARMFNAMVKTGRFDVLIIWGQPSQPESMLHWQRGHLEYVTLADVKAFIRNWYLKVEGIL